MAPLLYKLPAFTATTRRSAFRFAKSSGVGPRCRPNVGTFAKSKSGKGGKQQKGSALDKLLKAKEEASGVAGDAGAEVPLADQYNSPDVMMLLLVLTNSYWQSTKQYLMEDVDFEQLALALYEAPFALLVHDKHANDEPAVTYANLAALSVLGAQWADVVGSSSALYAVDGKDSVLSPQGTKKPSKNTVETWIQSRDGKQLKVRDALIFDVQQVGGDTDGELLGQAVKFVTVEREDGSLLVLDPATAAAMEKLRVPDAEEVAAAQAGVEEQAAVVRGLKEGRGLTNQDAEVVEAVAELLKRKEWVAEMTKRRKDAGK